MKFFGASLVLLAAIAGSTALPETNGERLARGLGPKPPALLRRTPAGELLEITLRGHANNRVLNRSDPAEAFWC